MFNKPILPKGKGAIMAKIVHMIFPVSKEIKRESRKATKAARTLPEADLLMAEAEVDGLLTMDQTVYAIRATKADPLHNSPEVVAEAEESNNAYKQARALIAARTKAKSIVGPARARYTATMRAEAELAAEEAEEFKKTA